MLLWPVVVWAVLMVAVSAGRAGTRVEPAASLRDRGVGLASDEQLRWIVNEYGRMIYRVALAIVHDRALAEDVVQDTIVKAWISMPSWEAPGAARWLRTVARNGAISVWRQRARSVDDPAPEGRASSGADVERVVEGRALTEAVWAALEQLDPDSRILIVMRETEESSYEEMAHLVGLSVPAVKAKLYRARQALRARLRAWEV
ncbi:MAG: RNA polymerase sigma factor [Acidimicrobiales bacterium]